MNKDKKMLVEYMKKVYELERELFTRNYKIKELKNMNRQHSLDYEQAARDVEN